MAHRLLHLYELICVLYMYCGQGLARVNKLYLYCIILHILFLSLIYKYNKSDPAFRKDLFGALKCVATGNTGPTRNTGPT